MDQDNLQQFLDDLSKVIDLLYQENVTVAYGGLVGVIPRLEEVLAQLDEDTRREMTEKLQTALTAMEEGDNTLLADVLQYEIMEQIKACM
jgi:hypothetical protein